MPILILPTDRDNGISPEHVEGALVVPFAVKLTDKFGARLQRRRGVRARGRSDKPRRGVSGLRVALLRVERQARHLLRGRRPRSIASDPLGDIAFVGTGFTYKINKNLQLDGGVNFGVTRASDRVNPFIGLSARF